MPRGACDSDARPQCRAAHTLLVLVRHIARAVRWLATCPVPFSDLQFHGPRRVKHLDGGKAIDKWTQKQRDNVNAVH